MSFLTLIFWIMVFIIWALVGLLMIIFEVLSTRSHPEPPILKKILLFPAKQIVSSILKRR